MLLWWWQLSRQRVGCVVVAVAVQAYYKEGVCRCPEGIAVVGCGRVAEKVC